MKISTLQIHRVLCGNNVDLDDLSCLVTIAGAGSNIRTTTIFDWTSTVSPRIRSSLMLLPDVPSVLFAIAATIQLCRLSSHPYGEAKGETPSFRFLNVGTNAQIAAQHVGWIGARFRKTDGESTAPTVRPEKTRAIC